MKWGTKCFYGGKEKKMQKQYNQRENNHLSRAVSLETVLFTCG